MSRPIERSKREKIYRRDNYSCVYCGFQGSKETLTIDHIIPRRLKDHEFYEEEYGVSREEIALFHYPINGNLNLVSACFDCNHEKRGKSLREFFKERPYARRNFLARATHINRKILEALAS